MFGTRETIGRPVGIQALKTFQLGKIPRIGVHFEQVSRYLCASPDKLGTPWVCYGLVNSSRAALGAVRSIGIAVIKSSIFMVIPQVKTSLYGSAICHRSIVFTHGSLL